MRKNFSFWAKLLFIVSVLVCGIESWGQVPILYYDFENNVARTTDENAVEQAANSGSFPLSKAGGGTIGGVAGAGTFNNGAATGRALTCTNWATATTDPGTGATSYYEFEVNTSGFSDISISFDNQASNTGPAVVGVLWSINGTTFNSTTVGATGNNTFTASPVFSLGSSANNQTSVTIRIYAFAGGIGDRTGRGTFGAGGTFRIDNLTVFAKTVTATKSLLDYPNIGLSIKSGTNFTPSYNSLVIGGSSITVSLTDSLHLTDSLDFSNVNNSTFSSGGFLVLKSTSAKTARVTDLTNNGTNSGNSITGNVTVERYLPSRRRWSLVTSPLRGGGSVFTNWQNNGTVNGSGVEIWGPGGNIATNGIAPSAPNTAYSIRKYNPAGNAWENVTNTKTEMLSTSAGSNNGGNADNKSFAVFATGPFANGSGNISSGASATTVKATGTLQTGNQLVPLNNNAGRFLTLMGNPYASPINFTTIATNTANTAMAKRFWIWDASVAPYGQYKCVYKTSAGWKALPYNPTLLGQTAQPAGDLIYIQSGQAVFIQNTTAGSGGNITIRESDKAIPGSYPDILRTTSTEKEFGITLFSNGDMLDGTLVEFDNAYSADVNPEEDATKPFNDFENLAVSRNGRLLMLEGRPVPTLKDTVYLYPTRLKGNQTYKLVFSATNLGFTGMTGTLLDSYTGTSTAISLNGLTEYEFTLSNPSIPSADINRFRVVFGPSTVLPVTFTTLKAAQQKNTVQVDWSILQEQNVLRYDIERSSNAIDFVKMGSVPARNNSGLSQYTWIDNMPENGVNYYRIKTIENSGASKVSQIVKVKMGLGKADEISVYPNPVKGRNFVLQVNLDKGIYECQIYNGAGQQVHRQSLNHGGGNASETIQLPANSAAGVYTIELRKGKDQIRKTLVVQ